MRYPLINKRPRQAVVVPDLAGGINLRDSKSSVLDNQLTDGLNVWFKDGVLKTRPGVGDLTQHEGEQGCYENAMTDAKIRAHDIYKTSDSGEILRLISAYIKNKAILYVFWVGKNNFVELPRINLDGFSASIEDYFFVRKDNVVYCFLDNGSISKMADGADGWDTVDDIHVPTVIVDGKPMKTSYNEGCTGVFYESYNLINNKYEAIYSTYSDDCALSDNTCQMVYFLPLIPQEGSQIIIEHTIADGTIATHSLTIPAGNKEIIETEANKKDGKKVKVYKTRISFHTDSELSPATVAKSDYVKDNLKITVTYKRSDEWKKVFKSRFATWFGGGTKGLNGGSRLFLGGNSEEPNLVLWSDLNNPLYFPENNYFYVGDSSGAVTAFGKQSDMLVIFKERETYYTRYEQNTSITSEDLINQNVIDYIAESVYFPLVQINASIGCDCPDTVQLCRNRLVWTCSNGRVYTLVSNNQYNERNVFEIGELIHRKLREDKSLKKAYSCDWNGYYVLFSNNAECIDAYLLDYNSYGYQYVSSYSKNEDANLKIPWYYWQFSKIGGDTGRRVFTVLDTLKLLATRPKAVLTANISDEYKTDQVYSTDTTINGIEIYEKPIESMLQTKLFEFSTPGYYKNIDSISLSLGANDAAPISVQIVTDMGAEENEVVLEHSDSNAYSPEYIKSVALHPTIKSVHKAGVRLACNGQIAVDSLTINYRILGGAK